MAGDPPEIRASHEDRERVMDVLRVAGGDGRLTAEELDARLESAFTARTLGDLAALTADLPAEAAAALTARDVLVFEHQSGRHTQAGRWVVPKRIELRTKLSRVTLDFTEAVITARTLRVDMDMQHGKLVIVTTPDVVIYAVGLALTFSKLKLRPVGVVTEPRLRVELAGTLKHGKVIERRR